MAELRSLVSRGLQLDPTKPGGEIGARAIRRGFAFPE
jgi:hypothetical protein